MTNELVEAINQYGFPIIAAMGLGYFVYYIWQWVTQEIKPMLGEANTTLIALIDRIRMLDNDLIRLNTKLKMIEAHSLNHTRCVDHTAGARRWTHRNCSPQII